MSHPGIPDFFDWVYGFDVTSQSDYDGKMTMNEQMVLDDLDSCGQPGTFVMSSGLYSFLWQQPHRDDPETDVYFFHSDHLGSTSYITAFDGTPYQHVEYLPFGEVLLEEKAGTWLSPYRFNCKELDDESRLYYYGARYYSGKWGIWLGVDPKAIDYPEWSPYNYCKQNPVKYIDKKGENPFAIIGAFVGGATEIVSQTISNGLNNFNNGKGFFNGWAQKMDWADVAISTAEGAAAGMTMGVSLLATHAVGATARSAVDWKGSDQTPKVVGGSGTFKKSLKSFGLDMAGEALSLGIGHLSGLSDIKFQPGPKVDIGNAFTEIGLKGFLNGIGGLGINTVKDQFRHAEVTFPPMPRGKILLDL